MQRHSACSAARPAAARRGLAHMGSSTASGQHEYPSQSSVCSTHLGAVEAVIVLIQPDVPQRPQLGGISRRQLVLRHGSGRGGAGRISGSSSTPYGSANRFVWLAVQPSGCDSWWLCRLNQQGELGPEVHQRWQRPHERWGFRLLPGCSMCFVALRRCTQRAAELHSPPRSPGGSGGGGGGATHATAAAAHQLRCPAVIQVWRRGDGTRDVQLVQQPRHILVQVAPGRRAAASNGGMVSWGGRRRLAARSNCSRDAPVGAEVAAWPRVLPGRLAEHSLPPSAPLWLPFRRPWLLCVLVQRFRCFLCRGQARRLHLHSGPCCALLPLILSWRLGPRQLPAVHSG